MRDERQDSIRQGINAPEESPAGQAAAEERRKRFARGPAFGEGMGGTSDAERAGDEAGMNAALSESERREQSEGDPSQDDDR